MQAAWWQFIIVVHSFPHTALPAYELEVEARQLHGLSSNASLPALAAVAPGTAAVAGLYFGSAAAGHYRLQLSHQHLRQGSAVAGGAGPVGAAGHVWAAGECGDAERGHGRVPKGRGVAEGAGAVHHVARGTRPKQRRVLWHRHERSGARALPLAPGDESGGGLARGQQDGAAGMSLGSGLDAAGVIAPGLGA